MIATRCCVFAHEAAMSQLFTTPRWPRWRVGSSIPDTVQTHILVDEVQPCNQDTIVHCIVWYSTWYLILTSPPPDSPDFRAGSARDQQSTQQNPYAVGTKHVKIESIRMRSAVYHRLVFYPQCLNRRISSVASYTCPPPSFPDRIMKACTLNQCWDTKQSDNVCESLVKQRDHVVIFSFPQP
jgi:hypothetical protein